MEATIAMTPGFLTDYDTRLLRESPLPDRPRRVLLRPLRFSSAVLGRVIEAPAGFVLDEESWPAWLPWWVTLSGPAVPDAGAIHDWLAASHECSFEEGCLVFGEALEARGLDPIWRDQRVQAVRMWGRKAWEPGPSRLTVLPI